MGPIVAETHLPSFSPSAPEPAYNPPIPFPVQDSACGGQWTVVGSRPNSKPDITKLHPGCLAPPTPEVEASLELSLETSHNTPSSVSPKLSLGAGRSNSPPPSPVPVHRDPWGMGDHSTPSVTSNYQECVLHSLEHHGTNCRGSHARCQGNCQGPETI